MPRSRAKASPLFWPLLVIAITAAILLPCLSYAQEAASVGVGDTSLSLSGKTSPDAYVTIQANQAVIGTLTADSSGHFSQSFPARTPGITQLGISARDAQNRTTDTVILQVNLQEHLATPVDVFLPPAIGLSVTTARAGQEIQLTGTGLPGSQIVLSLDNQTIGSAIVSPDGSWVFPILTLTLTAGQHQLFAINIDDSGNQSFATSLRTFTITSPANRLITPNTPKSSPIPTKPSNHNVHSPSSSAVETPGKQLQVTLQTNPKNIASGKQVRITAVAANGLAPLSYTFIWGDGQTDTIVSKLERISAAHTYIHSGNYTGKVEIKDISGATTTSFFTVHVEQTHSLTTVIWFIAGILLCLCLYLMTRRWHKQILARLHRR